MLNNNEQKHFKILKILVCHLIMIDDWIVIDLIQILNL
jgi:hypothetical protein